MADELIDLAERALRNFGSELNREQAALLLTMWKYNSDLTPAERTAVLDRFPSMDTVGAVR